MNQTAYTVHDDAAQRGRIPPHYVKMHYQMISQSTLAEKKKRIHRRKIVG